MPAPIAWTVYAHRATLASSASDGRHELRVGVRVVSEDDAAQLQNVLNESASTGSQARMTARRWGLCPAEGARCAVRRGSARVWQALVCSPRRL